MLPLWRACGCEHGRAGCSKSVGAVRCGDFGCSVYPGDSAVHPLCVERNGTLPPQPFLHVLNGNYLYGRERRLKAAVAGICHVETFHWTVGLLYGAWF